MAMGRAMDAGSVEYLRGIIDDLHTLVVMLDRIGDESLATAILELAFMAENKLRDFEVSAEIEAVRLSEEQKWGIG